MQSYKENKQETHRPEKQLVGKYCMKASVASIILRSNVPCSVEHQSDEVCDNRHTRTHAHTYTHARTYVGTYARTHARTHADTHIHSHTAHPCKTHRHTHARPHTHACARSVVWVYVYIIYYGNPTVIRCNLFPD